jgi:O-antigen/teichoic acid export membrane protein
MEKLRATLKGVLLHPGFIRYSKNTNWLFFGRLSTLLVSFFVSIYVARYLGPSNYGLLSYVISFVSLFSFMTNLGLDQIFARELVKHPEQERELLGTALALKCVGGVTAFVLALLVSLYLKNDFFTRSLVFIIGLSSLFQPLLIIIGYYQSKADNKYPAIISLLVTVLLSMFKIFVISHDKGLYYFSFVFALEPILYATFLTYLFIKKEYSLFSWKFNPKIALSLFRDSWPLMLTAAFTVMYTRVDQIMIKHLLGQTSVGLYDVGVRIAEFWYFVPGIFVTALYPALINAQKNNIESYRRRLGYLFSFLIIISTLFALPLSIFSSKIMVLLYGVAYTASAHILAIYVWAGVAVSLWIGVSQFLIVENNRYTIFTASLVSMTSNVVLNFILIPRFGIEGAAYATLFSYFLLPVTALFFKKTRNDLHLIFRAFRK